MDSPLDNSSMDVVPNTRENEAEEEEIRSSPNNMAQDEYKGLSNHKINKHKRKAAKLRQTKRSKQTKYHQGNL